MKKKALVCGAGYIFTGEHDADVMHKNLQKNIRIKRELRL